MPKRKAGQELTEREEAFVNHLLADPKRNQTSAALKAGYSEKVARITAAKKVSQDNIKTAIEKKLEPIQKKLAIDRDYIVTNLHHLVETCKDTGSEHFDPAAVNRSLELLMKALGLATDKIQLQAEVNNRHSIDMVRLLEVDNTSQEAFETIMERHRQQRLEAAQ
jgi:phage terminase small subunit